MKTNVGIPVAVIYLLLFSLIVLQGCSVTSELTKEERAKLSENPALMYYTAKNEYLNLLIQAVAYESQPPCTETVITLCSDPKIVAKLREIDKRINQAFKTAEPIVFGAGSLKDRQAAAKLARSALAELSRYLIAQQIREAK